MRMSPLVLIGSSSLVLAIVFVAVDIGGVGTGLPFYLFLGLTFLGILTLKGGSFFLGERARAAFTGYMAVGVLMLVSFVAGGNLTSIELRYLASFFATGLVFPLLSTLAGHTPRSTYRVITTGLLAALATFGLGYCMMVLGTGNLFILREHGSGYPLSAVLSLTAMRNPNRVGRVLIALSIGLLFWRSADHRKRLRFWLGVSVGFSGFLIFVSLSRANLLAYLLLLFAWSQFGRSIGGAIRRALAFSVLAVGLVAFLPPLTTRFRETVPIFEDLRRGEIGYGVSLRARTWIASIDLLSDNAIFGVGIADVAPLLASRGSVAEADTDLGFVPILVHGGFLKIAIYGGLLSVTAFCGFLFFLFLSGLHRYRETGEHRARAAGYWLATAIPVLAAANIGGDSFGLPVTWIVLAWLVVNEEPRTPLRQLTKSRVPTRAESAVLLRRTDY